MQCHPARFLLLLAALAALPAHAAAPPSLPGGYDAYVDLDAGLLYEGHGITTKAEAGNSCKLMQRALNPILARSTPHTPPRGPAGRVAHRSVRISGRAVIGPSDLSPVPFCVGGDGCRAGGEDGVDTTSSGLSICVGVYGSTKGKAGHADPDGLANGYPIVDNTALEGGLPSGFLDLFWDNVVIEYDGAAQTGAAALIYKGACWLEGASYAGHCAEDPARSCKDDSACRRGCRDVAPTLGCAAHVNDFLNETGSLKIVYTGESDAGAPPSGTVAMRESGDAGPFWTPTTAVAIWDDGLLRGQLSGLSVTLHGRVNDDDDVGLLHRFAWGRYRRGWRISGFGVGVLYYGNAVGSLEQSYVSGNDVNLSFGDWEDGGDLRWFSRCVSGYCGMLDTAAGNSQYVTDSIVEGGSHGNIVIWEGGAQYFRGIYTENGAGPNGMAGHSIVLGPGRCKADFPQRICAFDADCDRGTCDSDFANPRTLKTFDFEGKIDGDHDHPRWDALAIGKYFVGRDGYVKISGRLGASFDGKRRLAFTVPPSGQGRVEVPVDLSDAVFAHGGVDGLPAYANIVHDRALLVPFTFEDAAASPGDCVSLMRGPSRGARAACEAPEAQLPLGAPGVGLDRFALASLAIDAPARLLARAPGCDLVACQGSGAGSVCAPIARCAEGGSRACARNADCAASCQDASLRVPSGMRGARASRLFEGLSLEPRPHGAIGLRLRESTPGACDDVRFSGALRLIPLPVLGP